MGDVVEFRGNKNINKTPDEALKEAMGEMTDVFILGYDHDNRPYFSSTTSDGGDLLWLIEMFKKMLLNGDLEA